MVDGGVVSRPASAASSHASTPSKSPSERRLHPSEVASSGRRRTTSSGSAASQSRRVRSWRRRRRSASGELDEVGGVLVVAACDRVPHGIAQQPVLGEPSAGRGVQLADPVGMPGSQAGTQRVGEEVVVAVPPALVVERDDEQVLALEGLQHRLTVGATGQGVAQTAGQLVEHGGVEQERADLVRLPVQDLLDEVVEDEPMASGEGLDEPGDVAGARRHGSGPTARRAAARPPTPRCAPRARPRARDRGAAPSPR